MRQGLKVTSYQLKARQPHVGRFIFQQNSQETLRRLERYPLKVVRHGAGNARPHPPVFVPCQSSQYPLEIERGIIRVRDQDSRQIRANESALRLREPITNFVDDISRERACMNSEDPR